MHPREFWWFFEAKLGEIEASTADDTDYDALEATLWEYKRTHETW